MTEEQILLAALNLESENMDHEFYMNRCIELARKGWPDALPNPLVGSLIVHQDKVVAEGWHARFGEAHAEVMAVGNLPLHLSPAQCTLYVTLEPCAHQGKTPPCAQMLVSKGFGQVVIGSRDPNPLVSGKGIAILQKAGIRVLEGVLEDPCKALNKPFFTFHESRRPYILLKWAVTADGFIGRAAGSGDKAPSQITRKEANTMVHGLRARSAAILVGTRTLLSDNPLLTTRLVAGKNPVRVVIDKELRAPADSRVFGTEAPTLVFNSIKTEKKGNIEWISLDFSGNMLAQLLKELHSRGLLTLLVEGGSETLQGFVDAGLWDEAYVLENPDLSFGSGVKAPVFPLKNSFELIGEDKLYHHVKNEAMPASGALSKEIF